jgi:hypothetical protein
MAKKSSGHRTRKTPPRHLHHTEPWPAAPAPAVEEPPVAASAAETVARPTVTLRRPGTQPAYTVRRDRQTAAAAAAVPMDYSYVLRDLRRVGLLLAIILVLLVALTLVLR